MEKRLNIHILAEGIENFIVVFKEVKRDLEKDFEKNICIIMEGYLILFFSSVVFAEEIF